MCDSGGVCVGVVDELSRLYSFMFLCVYICPTRYTCRICGDSHKLMGVRLLRIAG
jgi:hypothetical protein